MTHEELPSPSEELSRTKGVPRRLFVQMAAVGAVSLALPSVEAQEAGVKYLDFVTHAPEIRAVLSRVRDGSALVLDARDPHSPGEVSNNGGQWGLRCGGTNCPPQNTLAIPALSDDVDLVFSEKDEERLVGISKDREILVVCAAGVRSEWALRKLRILGFSNLVTLRGGIGSIPDSELDIRFGVAPRFPMSREREKNN